jgi:UDP-N-acetylglucosamine--N-acetylmuramyl-(pentapeptide) pyrophosphoryl-undecaprenol N-acetylglucosamine transferase
VVNSAAIEGLPITETALRDHLTHQTGELDHARVKEAYDRAGVSVNVIPFLYDMPAAIDTADAS